MEKEKVYIVWHFKDSKGLLLKIFKHHNDAEQYIEKLKKDCPEYWENEELDIGEEELS